jgi:hypothetical protein
MKGGGRISSDKTQHKLLKGGLIQRYCQEHELK